MDGRLRMQCQWQRIADSTYSFGQCHENDYLILNMSIEAASNFHAFQYFISGFTARIKCSFVTWAKRRSTKYTIRCCFTPDSKFEVQLHVLLGKRKIIVWSYIIPDALSRAISLLSLYASMSIDPFWYTRLSSFLAPFIISSANWKRIVNELSTFLLSVTLIWMNKSLINNRVCLHGSAMCRLRNSNRKFL